jgi:hypothetical protein
LAQEVLDLGDEAGTLIPIPHHELLKSVDRRVSDGAMFKVESLIS